MKVIQIQNQFKLLSNLFVVLITVGSILSYTSYSTVGQVSRLAGQFGIILLYIWKVDFEKYSFVYPILLTFVMYPLFLSMFGIYSNLHQVLTYVCFFLWFLISLICIAECYMDNLAELYRIFYITIVISLSVLFVLYRGIALNIGELVSAIISNRRYGGDISTARVSMGFQNVNQLGLFAVILTIFAFYFLVKKRSVILNLVVLSISLILILNSGSRTPLLALFVFGGIYFVYQLKNVVLRRLGKVILVLIFSFIYTLFIYLIYFSKSDSTFFQLIDGLFSYRISFSQEALNLVSKLGNPIVGIGPMSSSYIQNAYTGGNFAIDSSIAYYLLTLGWIGTLGLNFSTLYLMYKINRTLQPIVISMFGFYIAYSFFENVLFTPNSGLGIIVLSIVFSTVRQQNVYKSDLQTLFMK